MPGQSMKHYRAYQVDPDGHVFGCIDLVCNDDEQAKREAAALVLIYRIELWRLDKRIAHFEGPAGITSRQAEGKARVGSPESSDRSLDSV
jgi:hypothetical protein